MSSCPVVYGTRFFSPSLLGISLLRYGNLLIYKVACKLCKSTNYRTIFLISHTNKILLRMIILERIRVKTESKIADEQAGFRPGRGQETKSQISECWCTKHVSTSNHSRPMWTPRRHSTLSLMISSGWLMDIGYLLHLINLPAKLYRKRVKVAGTLSEWFHVKKGVRQGCVLSPYLFNILAEMMRETLGPHVLGSDSTHNRLTENAALDMQWRMKMFTSLYAFMSCRNLRVLIICC